MAVVARIGIYVPAIYAPPTIINFVIVPRFCDSKVIDSTNFFEAPVDASNSPTILIASFLTKLKDALISVAVSEYLASTDDATFVRD